MTQPLFIKMNDADNVAVAVKPIKANTQVLPDIIAIDDIPQSHKIALKDFAPGEDIIRYGTVIGRAIDTIKAGRWINEHMLHMPNPPELDEMVFATNIVTDLPPAPTLTWEGYKNPNGGYGGTKNILGINTTVQCVTGVLNVAVARMKEELLPKYPNVDDIVPINHAYGCGVAINAREAHIPIRSLKNIAQHPNFGGQMMLVGLGCEKLTPDMLLSPEENTPENVLILHEHKGFEAMVQALMEMAEKKLAILNERRRETLPLSDLLVGLQCGGSDAFSGITANPSAGWASDMLVQGGATVLFSEVTEVRDGVYLLAQRCVDETVGKRLVEEMRWYDDYLEQGGANRSANTSPGNKKGGLANIAEKAMGSIVKSGSAPIIEVLSPAQVPTKSGLIYAATPASDIVCGPCQLASGIGVQVFMTGVGTPYGLAVSPVIKVCSRNEMKDMWSDLIDVNAGPIATGEASIAQIGEIIFQEIIDVASGRKKPFTDQHKIYNDMCIFNPAPIT